MKKIIAVFIALFFAMAAFAGPASATGGDKVADRPGGENKPVTICHATGSDTNPYTKITTNVNGWYNSHRNGHGADGNDIWRAFSYTNRDGDTITVPQQGNVNLLDTDCAEPRVDEEIAKPSFLVVDKCETANDSVSVPPGTGYTVGQITGSYPNFSVTITANDGFKFTDGSKSVTLTTSAADFPNNDNCDLPETGGEAQYNVNMGIGAVALLLLGAGAFFLIRRKA